MQCDHDWTVKFIDAVDGRIPEIRPIEMTLKSNRARYDYCKAKFPPEVGRMLKQYTDDDSDTDFKFDRYTKVNVCHNGNNIQSLCMRPDWVSYGSDYTHIEFKDLHKSLNSGTVDIQKDKAELKPIYLDVLDEAEDTLINDVKITLPDEERVRIIYGTESAGGGGLLGGSVSTDFEDGGEKSAREIKKETAQDDSKGVVESKYAIDFENISPEKAIDKLNKKFRLKTWVNREDNLVVGIPEATMSRTHVAAPNDSRVWRYKDVSVAHGREPIWKVLVEGSWVDEPGWGGFDELADEVGSWFGGDDDKGSSDVRAFGVAERKDVNYGTVVFVKGSNGKKDALPDVAESALREEMKNQSAGTLQIDPQLSGNRISRPSDLRPGDLVRIVPDDRYFDNPTATSGSIQDQNLPPIEDTCGGFVNNQSYLASEIQHHVGESGHWEMEIDIARYPNIDPKSQMAYFDPEENKLLTEENSKEVKEDGDLAGGLLEGI